MKSLALFSRTLSGAGCRILQTCKQGITQQAWLRQASAWQVALRLSESFLHIISHYCDFTPISRWSRCLCFLSYSTKSCKKTKQRKHETILFLPEWETLHQLGLGKSHWLDLSLCAVCVLMEGVFLTVHLYLRTKLCLRSGTQVRTGECWPWLLYVTLCWLISHRAKLNFGTPTYVGPD